MAICRVCGHDMPDAASVCVKCGWATGWYAAGLWTARVITAVIIPATLLFLSWSWNASEHRRSASDDFSRAQSEVIANITEQLVQLTSNAGALRDATAAVQRGCLPSTPRSSAISDCFARYADGLEALDRVVTRISWQTDTLPVVSERTYGILNDIKDAYWRACDNGQPFERCGYRQRLVRLVYGYGSPRDSLPGLRTCDGAAAEAPPCAHARDALGAMVVSPFEDEANVFFCSIVDDVNDTRREALGHAPSDAVDRDERMERLLARLDDNMKHSRCRVLLDRWSASHRSTP